MISIIATILGTVGINIPMPHRELINRSLRNATDNLRSSIDDYQQQYNAKIEKCKTEIEEEKLKKDTTLEKIKDSLVGELSKDKEFFNSIYDNFQIYVDRYFQHHLIEKEQEMNTLETETLTGCITHLSEQIKLENEDIKTLEDRKNKLTQLVNVDDFIRLINLSECKLNLECVTDISSLLEKTIPLEKENSSIYRLRKILQEKSEFLSSIKYISWVIEQKDKFTKQLKLERRENSKSKQIKKQELDQLTEDIKILKLEINTCTKSAQGIWEIPLRKLSEEIDSEIKKRSELIEDKRNLYAKLEQLETTSINYESDKKYVNHKINMKLKEINDSDKTEEDLKHQQLFWLERLLMIYSICNHNFINIDFVPQIIQRELDKCKDIKEKILEIQQKNKALQEEHNQKLENLQNEYGDKIETHEKWVSSWQQKRDNSAKDAKIKSQEYLEAMRSDNRSSLKKFWDKLWGTCPPVEICDKNTANEEAKRIKDETSKKLDTAKQNLAKIEDEFGKKKNFIISTHKQDSSQLKCEIDNLETKKVELLANDVIKKLKLRWNEQ